MKRHPGFTLMELTVAIIIFGVLASLTANAYISVVERGRWTGAREVLLKAYSGYQRALDDENPVVNNATFWTQLGMSNPNTMPGLKFVYTIVNPFPRVQAQRSTAAGDTWTIELDTGAVTKTGNAPDFQ
jgi:prepilin-type N-terminal cleavage/methylation domain-containing protein